MSGNVEDARKLIREKARLRSAEIAAAEQHFERLREARAETLETTSIHLDVLRDLKRIHSHICSVAYPVLEAAGEMAAADVTESDPVTLALPGGKPAADSSGLAHGIFRSITVSNCAPSSTAMVDSHIHIIRPMAAPSEP